MTTGWLIAALRGVQFRGKARLLGPLAPRSGVKSAIVHGCRVDLDLSDHVQRAVYLGAYERWETGVVRRLLRPGGCFVDVGANVGYFTLLAARLVGPGGKVFAIEPSPYAADRLATATSVNGLANVRLERCGLGREAGEAILYDPLPDNHSPTMLGESGKTGKTGQTVLVRCLDECVRDWGVDRIDLLKVDVEGYEPAVFAGAARSLAAGVVRAILVEFNPYWLERAGVPPAEMYRALLAFGFADADPNRGEPDPRHVENRLFVWPAAGPAAR
jgi:FkbM family methyltransferase